VYFVLFFRSPDFRLDAPFDGRLHDVRERLANRFTSSVGSGFGFNGYCNHFTMNGFLVSQPLRVLDGGVGGAGNLPTFIALLHENRLAIEIEDWMTASS
jgi:hypothetical protein